MAMHEAFQNSCRYQLTTYNYSLAYYDNVISNVFGKFLTTYPQSAYCPEIQNTLKTWNAERDEVAKGSIKYNNKWYQGEEAKAMYNSIQVAQLIGEGDRQLQYQRYESAIGQYQRALQQRPLGTENLSALETKINAAFSAWNASAASMASTPNPDIQSKQRSITLLQQSIAQKSQEAARIEAWNNEIAGAHFHKTSNTTGYWVTPSGKNMGSTLPAQNLLGVNALKQQIASLQQQIAKENAAITASQSSNNAAPNAALLANIQNVRTQLDAEIAKARSSLTQEGETVMLVSSVTTQQMASANTQQSTLPQQTTEPEASQKTPVVTPDDSLHGERVSWWKQHWLFLSISALIILLYFAFRRK